jgi:opacity protein-like surface antigen
MAVFRPLVSAAAVIWGANAASAMDLSTSTTLPEASEVLGWYGSLSTGRDKLSDFSVCFDPIAGGSVDCFADSQSTKQALDNGLIFEASMGYAFPNGLRLSGELSDRRDLLGRLNEIDRYEQTRQLAVMLSGSYDFDTHSPLTPFIGAGFGGVRVENGDADLFESRFDLTSEKSEWKLGLEGFAGLQYEFSPELRLGLRYSHKVVSKVGGDSAFDSSADIGSADAGSLRSRALMLTLTYEFGGP